MPFDIDFSEVENPDIREAYEMIYPKFLAAPTEGEKERYWKILSKIGEWELKEIEELKSVLIRNWNKLHPLHVVE